jgi:small subunit ribosomal protein S8
MPGVITDPIADMLTRIRNGLQARHSDVRMPHSKLKSRIAEILVEQGYIAGAEVLPSDVQSEIHLELKYTHDRRPVITGLRRVSKPGLRVYSGRKSIAKVQGGLGISIVSTSRGLMTDRDARRQGIGGEVLCEVW